MNFNINNDYELADNEGSSVPTGNKFIVLHETTNVGAKSNAIFFKNNWATTETYVQYVIGDGGKIFHVGGDGYQAWGAGSYANANSPVQIELARTFDKETFKKDYAALINFARTKATQYGIPMILDTGTQYTNGVKTHKWISDNIWGSHIDPVVSYLQPFWGVTHEQLAHDIAVGISEPATVKPTKVFTNINNIVYTLNDNVKGYTTYDESGKPNATTNIAPNTGWVSNGIVVYGNQAYYAIGRNIYIPQSVTKFNGKVLINSDIPVHAVNLKGEPVNVDLKGGSDWAYKVLVQVPNVGWAYKIATDMYLPTKFAQGSGYKG